MNFENNFKEFEAIVKKLEDPSLTLNDGVALFEKGVALLKECYASLGEAKGKITVLTKELDGIIEGPLNLEEDKNK